MTRSPARTRTALTAAGLTLAVALAGCGNGNGNGGENGGNGEEAQEEVELRFSFWGSDARVQNTEEIIEVFEEEYPHITVNIEYSDWGGFWDQLNTQLAAGDGPDIFQMDAPNIREYAEQGSLLDLSDVDLTHIPDEIIASGTIDDAYYGLASGVTAPAIVANPRLFEEAGVELPDDTTWTWDDYSEIAQEISENLDDVYGSAGPDGLRMMQMWMRQNDSALTTEDGELGFSQDEAQAYLEWQLELYENGTYPPNAVMVEDAAAGADQNLISTGGAAMAMSLTNLLGGISDANGEDMVLLRLPSPTGNVEDAMQWYNTGMVSANAHTEHPEEVVTFLDFFVNDIEAARINMADRGLSANTEIRPQLMEEMDDMNRASAEFLTEIEDELGPPEPVPASGQATLGDILERYQEELFFERLTPEEAAEQMYPEMENAVG
ncbi:ABC transporter substrate-binding protein [Nesterenkonia alba]|uniref:ABC transporter substrate-binding protein n=1 Tax=Nesterenkonia alba TaxID=515814 RepID=UPI0003B6216C|nr:extracellular solute-binding protein [Nesterenkonia alba]